MYVVFIKTNYGKSYWNATEGFGCFHFATRYTVEEVTTNDLWDHFENGMIRLFKFHQADTINCEEV